MTNLIKKNNQDLRKYIEKDYETIKNLRLQIIELERIIDFKDNKHMSYVKKTQEYIKKLEANLKG